MPTSPSLPIFSTEAGVETLCLEAAWTIRNCSVREGNDDMTQSPPSLSTPAAATQHDTIQRKIQQELGQIFSVIWTTLRQLLQEKCSPCWVFKATIPVFD